MPARMKRALQRSARKRGYKGKRAKRYVYGAMVNRGWRPRRRRRR